jgi:hypothetical protein
MIPSDVECGARVSDLEGRLRGRAFGIAWDYCMARLGPGSLRKREWGYQALRSPRYRRHETVNPWQRR